MGCICSKGAAEEDISINENEKQKQKELDKFSVQLVAPVLREEFVVGVGRKDGSVRNLGKGVKENVVVPLESEEGENTHHQRLSAMEWGSNEDQRHTARIISMPHASQAELTAAGWPQWLTTVAGEAVKGWLPRKVESFEKLEKIGQGTYSSVYKARDLETRKIVAMKKVRFFNMDPESVRFMAREIHILRKLDHPNVMKLEGIVTSRVSGSLFLVFEYMEHDLAGLAATPGMKFTEPQIKCYMQQLLRGLEHCHNGGALHRDIKGSNLLVNNDGVLKIADFGLATFYHPLKKQELTSRVVTLWYRAPELLLGATDYGVGVDMWSVGCILAELFAGKPIMPGRTEVEQMHKIFKLCGSPSKDYWEKTKLPHATSFKPQNSYKRCVVETFKHFPSSALALVDKLLSMEPESRGSATLALRSEFFKTEPLPCDPSSLPKYPPSKELDAKIRDQEARRRKAESVKRYGPESVRGPRELTNAQKLEFTGQGQPKITSTNYKYGVQEDPRGAKQNGFSHSTSMIHPSAVGLSLNKNIDSVRNEEELKSHKSYNLQVTAEISDSSLNKDERAYGKDYSLGYVPKKNRMHYSGPLVAPGGNIEDMLKEHDRQIQRAVRKARLEK